MLRNKLIDIIYRSATGSPRRRLLLTSIGPLFFFGLVALLVFASLRLDRLVGFPRFVRRPYDVAICSLLTGAGLLLMLWSVASFLRTRGTPVPFNPPPRLVDTGPYALCRNPMLTGLFLVLFGLGFYLGSTSLVFIFTPIFIVLNVWELKTVEEPELERRLGTEYVEYRKRVPMFYPSFKRWRRMERTGK
ncbi:MAG: isoprenylcysteine carboxylmethyltransferase family protein [bacterium]|nr:MAG: isoprenylcysteine carboxylmethyltransferase family protein [bacterium]